MAQLNHTINLDTSSIDAMLAQAKAIIAADEGRIPELQAIFADKDILGQAVMIEPGVLSFPPSERMRAFLGQ